MTKQIPLTQGQFAIVDDCDYERLSQFKWFAHKNKHTWYAQRNEPRGNGKRGFVHMHHEVLSVPPGTRVDHKDSDGLNNTRDNLRPATYPENNRNARKRMDNTSGYKGVSWHKGHRKWIASIRIDDKLRHLGDFATAEEAAAAYDKAAIAAWGEFARINNEFAVGLAGSLGGVEL